MRGTSIILIAVGIIGGLVLFVFGGLALLNRSAERATFSETTLETTAEETTTAESAPEETVVIDASSGERVEVEVEIADDDAERARGLMERTALAENAGMLFVFDREQRLSFYMKNTLIPLSIAYIDAEGRIVDIQDMEPLDETPHPSAEPGRYALEVNQGFFREHGVEVGDTVELPGQSDSSASVPSAAVVQGFRGAGLEVGESYPVEQEQTPVPWDQTDVPKTYEEATRFLIPSLGADAGGRVFVFGSEEDLATVRDYYEGLESSVRPYVYVEGLVLLQISNDLPEPEAEKYAAVLREMA